MSVMRLITIAIVLSVATTTFAKADHVSNRFIDGKKVLRAGLCIEDPTGHQGYCEVYEGGYSVFWSDPETIKWIIDADGKTVYQDGEVEA